MKLIIIFTRDKDEALRNAAGQSANTVIAEYSDDKVSMTIFGTASQGEAEEHARRRMEAE